MSHFHYIKGERPQFLGLDQKSESVTFFRYLLHYIYGANEPKIIRMADQIVDGIENAETPEERQKKINQFQMLASSKMTSSLPHAIVASHNAAKNVMDFAYAVEGPRGARIAVGPCVCQVALKRYPNGNSEPEIKDITLFYGSDIYNGLGAGYREITADEAKEILDDCHAKGYVHQALYCYNSGAGLFVMCNCDNQICNVVRGYNLSGAGTTKGPEICAWDEFKCLGVEECGMCIERCNFNANSADGNRVIFDESKCMGCEVCVTTCKGHARTMKEREDYEFEHVLSKKLMLAGRYDYEPLMELA